MNIKRKKNCALLVSSCDKFSDLWEWHFKFLNSHWKDIEYPIFLVTDKPTTAKIDGVTIIVADENMDFPMRIKFALKQIMTDYIILTLDDYYLIHNVNGENIDNLVNRAECEKIDYLLLYDRQFDKERFFEPINTLHEIDLNKSYAVTLYPAIWNKLFLEKTVKDNVSPWMYEVSLTATAQEENANCKYSQAGTFRILDVVRKGRILHKANRYFKKHNIDMGNRPLISYGFELKLAIMDWIYWYMPKPIYRGLKEIAKKAGMKFYSE